jgi:hypothetical protein
MKKLSEVVVGDRVYVTSLNYSKTFEPAFTVMGVGRKYIRVVRGHSEMQFEAATGRYANKDYSTHYHCYSEDEWQHHNRELAVNAALNAFSEVVPSLTLEEKEAAVYVLRNVLGDRF